MSRSTDAANESLGVVDEGCHVRQMAVKMLLSWETARLDGDERRVPSGSPKFRVRPAVNRGRSGRAGRETRVTRRVCSMSSSVTSRSSTSADIVSSTSSRTAGSNLRRTSSRSMACKQVLGELLVDLQGPLIRVTRKRVLARMISTSPNRSVRCAAMTSSIGHEPVSAPYGPGTWAAAAAP